MQGMPFLRLPCASLKERDMNSREGSAPRRGLGNFATNTFGMSGGGAVRVHAPSPFFFWVAVFTSFMTIFGVRA